MYSLDLEIVFGIILFLILYSFWSFLLLWVFLIVESIDLVILSAYIITKPFTFLAALPEVCINDFSFLKNPSLSASRIITNETSGRSNPSLNKLTPTKTLKSPSLNPLKILTLSKVSISECIYLQATPLLSKYLESSSDILFVKVVIKILSSLSTLRLISFRISSIWFSDFLTSILGSNNPVGLIICSTIEPPELVSSYSDGVAPTKITWFIIDSNSWKFKGLLSSADGNLKPYSTKFIFLDLSPPHIALTCGIVTWLSSINIKKLSGK